MTFFDSKDAYGWSIDFNVNKEFGTVMPVARKKDPVDKMLDEFVKKASRTAPIVTWVTLKQPTRDLCIHYLSVENGTWGDWGYLKWYYSYPNDHLPKLREMSEFTKYKRNIYFATHVIDEHCNYFVIYYGTTYAYHWGKMRGFLYGWTWDPDQWTSLDSLLGLNGRNHLYPRFILMPGVYPKNTGPVHESIIFYNDNKVRFGSAHDALYMRDLGEGGRMRIMDLPVSENGTDPFPVVYHSTMNIKVDKT